MRKRQIFILSSLVAGAIILGTISWIIFSDTSNQSWKNELSKAILGLGTSALIGGMIGGIIKLHLDKVQEDKKNYEKEIQEEKWRHEKNRDFKNDIVNRLRKTFDAVDTSRLIIEAHKSAKTYGEKMRENIIPSITTLYDIKRSLLDSHKIIGDEQLPLLRISLHYMIAYLMALSEEYKKQYPEISNSQFFEEAVRERVRQQFVDSLEKENLLRLFDKNTEIPPLFEFTWKKIENLKYLRDFLSDKRASWYYTVFIDHYEYCKEILKGVAPLLSIKQPESFIDKYLGFLEEADKKRKTQITNQKHISEGDNHSDNLVAKIMKDKLEWEQPLDEIKNPLPVIL